MLYILCGLPGAGQTTYAKELAEQQGAELFSLDDLLNEKYGNMHGCELQVREWAVKYEILPEIEELLQSGKAVILDFGFYKKAERDRYRKLAKLHSVPSETHYVTAKYETLLKRVTQRNKSEDNVHHIDKEILDTLISRFEEPKGDEPHTVISTN